MNSAAGSRHRAPTLYDGFGSVVSLDRKEMVLLLSVFGAFPGRVRTPVDTLLDEIGNGQVIERALAEDIELVSGKGVFVSSMGIDPVLSGRLSHGGS